MERDKEGIRCSGGRRQKFLTPLSVKPGKVQGGFRGINIVLKKL